MPSPNSKPNPNPNQVAPPPLRPQLGALREAALAPRRARVLLDLDALGVRAFRPTADGISWSGLGLGFLVIILTLPLTVTLSRTRALTRHRCGLAQAASLPRRRHLRHARRAARRR